MVVVRGKSPEINFVRPASVPERQERLLWIEGKGFTVASTVTVGGVAPAAVTLLADGRLECRLNGLQDAAEEAPIVVSEGVYESLPFPFKLTPGGAYVENYIEPVEDQQQVVLPASLRGRSDQQRMPAGQNYDGLTPNDEQGEVGDPGPAGLTAGGFWTYNNKVYVHQIEWNSDGVEPAARGAGSGIWIGREGGSEALLVDLANQRADAVISEGLVLGKGDYIRIVTVGATLEMVANVSHVVYTRRLSQ